MDRYKTAAYLQGNIRARISAPYFIAHDLRLLPATWQRALASGWFTTEISRLIIDIKWVLSSHCTFQLLVPRFRLRDILQMIEDSFKPHKFPVLYTLMLPFFFKISRLLKRKHGVPMLCLASCSSSVLCPHWSSWKALLSPSLCFICMYMDPVVSSPEMDISI